MAQIPIDGSLFTWPSDTPQLIGSRNKTTGRVTFPALPEDDENEHILLKTKGKLWSFTIQGFLPKTPPYAGPETMETFRPYGVGYIELEDETIVESRLTEGDPEKLQIGMDMELVIDVFKQDEDGNDIMYFAFKPAA